MRFLLCLLAMCLALVMLPVPSALADTMADVSRQKINLSGRQRMLTQRMASSACLAVSGADREERIAAAQQAHDDFSRALHGLQFGDAGLGLPPEQNGAILSAFSQVEEVWAGLSPAVQQVIAGDLPSVVLRQLVEENISALRLSNAAVQEIVANDTGQALAPELARAIDIAGRQRMLSQKMMKEACFVAIGLSTTTSFEALSGSIALFDKSLSQLRLGDRTMGIAAPPNGAIARQLAVVAELWGAYQAALVNIGATRGTALDPGALSPVAAMSDRVLAEAHKAVLLYVESAKRDGG